MPIQLRESLPDFLNLTTGKVTSGDIYPSLKEPQPTPEPPKQTNEGLLQKFQDLFSKGKTLSQVHSAINHPQSGFEDKEGVKGLAQKVYDQFHIQKTEISNQPKQTFSDTVATIHDQRPFFESRIGKSLKEEALTKYPFSKEATDYINKKAMVKDESAQYDRATQLSKEDGVLTVGKIDQSFAGVEHPEELANLLGLSTIQSNESFTPKEDDSVFGRIFKNLMSLSPTGNRYVGIKDFETQYVAHELTHVFQNKYPIVEEKFNTYWEKEKKRLPQDENVNPFLFIDKRRIEENPKLYNKNNKEQLAKERHAYFAQFIGIGGLDAIRNISPTIAPFYQKLFREDQNSNQILKDSVSNKEKSQDK